MKRIILGSLLLGTLVLGACGDDDADTAATTAPGSTQAAGPTAAAQAAPDDRFGTRGIAVSALSATDNDRFMAVAVGSDGGIFAAGFVTQGGDSSMALAKFKADGTADKSFGKAGVATVNVASGGKTAELARAVAIQSSGKIIIGGPVEHDTSATGDAARDTDIAVVRFDASGKLNPSFGQEGIAKIDLGTGRITSGTTLAGDTSWGLGSLPGDKVAIFASRLSTIAADRTDTDFVLVGLTASGALDTAFGTQGMTVVDLNGSGDTPRHLIVQSDGRIVAAGYSAISGVVSPVFIRTSATGQLDSAFGKGGVANTQILPGVAESYAVAVQGDNYISAGYGRGADSAEKVDLVIQRYKADGSRDKSFATDGLYRLDIAKDDDRARNVTVLPDGRILAIGSGKLTAANVDAMVILLSQDGAAVANFGEGGRLISDLGGPADAWYGVALTPDKKAAIIVGYKGVDPNSGGNDDAVMLKINL